MTVWKGKKIGDILVEAGAVDAYEAQAAAAHAEIRRIPVGQALVELGLADEDCVLRALASQIGTVVVDLAQVAVSRRVLDMVPGEVSTARRVLPLRVVKNARGRDTLVVAVSHPRNPALDEIAFLTGCRVAPVLVASADLDEALFNAYRAERSAEGAGIAHVADRYFEFGA